MMRLQKGLEALAAWVTRERLSEEEEELELFQKRCC